MPVPAIDLDTVRLTLASAAGPVSILNGISLQVPAGQTLALLGPSGSGKSSLLMVAAGLEAPSGGRVRIAGTELTGLGEDGLARFRRGHIGIVFQSFHLIPTMTALENVAVPLELAGLSDAFERARAELDAVGLAARCDHYPGQFRAASSSAWRWRAPSRPSRRCSLPTSPPAISTPRRAPTSPIFCSRCMRANARRCFSSRMRKCWRSVASASSGSRTAQLWPTT